MIVRISGEAQYRLADEQARELNQLEDEVVAIVEGGREDGFAQAYARLLGYVREHGERLPDEELAGSDVILPPADISFQEATRDFSGEGLIPD